MKALKICLIIIATLSLVIGTGYLYASSGVKSKLGYAELAIPKDDNIRPVLSFNLGPGGVKPARWLLDKIVNNVDHGRQVPERLLKNAINEIQAVQLRVYEVDNSRSVFDDAISESIRSLKQKNWQTLASVREDDVKIEVMQYTNGEQLVGLSFMASTSENAMFLNLIGPFNPEAIAQTVSH